MGEKIEATVDFRRSDYARFSAYMLFRHPISWVRFGILTVLCGGFILVLRGEVTSANLALAGVGGPVGGFVGLFLSFAVGLLVTAVIARESNGKLGEMTYSIEPEGVRLTSQSSEVGLRWRSVRGLRISKSQVLIGTGGTSYMIVPKRAFASDGDCDRFVARLRDHLTNQTEAS